MTPDEVPRAFELVGKPPYVPEPEDSLIPQLGWISDFVYATRGIESPVMFWLWCALWALASASGRRTYVKWGQTGELYPNLYIFLVAPPGKCRKTTAVDLTRKILANVHKEFEAEAQTDPMAKANEHLTHFNWVTNKTTPDAFYETLLPEPEKSFKVGEHTLKVSKGSQAVCCIGELETFINKKKYMEGIIGTLTDLYDSRDSDFLRTIKRGEQELREIFVTFLGAITPDGLLNSLPDEAKGAGFVSRVLIVKKDSTPRRFDTPIDFEGFPRISDLRKRLAWIISNKTGEYVIDEEASKWRSAWYSKYRDRLDGDDMGVDHDAEARVYVNLIRLATLISFSRYSPERVITLQDMLDAERLLKSIMPGMREMTDDLQSSGSYAKACRDIRRLIERKGTATKRDVSRKIGSLYIPTQMAVGILQQLYDEGCIIVKDAHGVVKDDLRWDTGETYTWKESTE